MAVKIFLHIKGLGACTRVKAQGDVHWLDVWDGEGNEVSIDVTLDQLAVLQLQLEDYIGTRPTA